MREEKVRGRGKRGEGEGEGEGRGKWKGEVKEGEGEGRGKRKGEMKQGEDKRNREKRDIMLSYDTTWSYFFNTHSNPIWKKEYSVKLKSTRYSRQ